MLLTHVFHMHARDNRIMVQCCGGVAVRFNIETRPQWMVYPLSIVIKRHRTNSGICYYCLLQN